MQGLLELLICSDGALAMFRPDIQHLQELVTIRPGFQISLSYCCPRKLPRSPDNQK